MARTPSDTALWPDLHWLAVAATIGAGLTDAGADAFIAPRNPLLGREVKIVMLHIGAERSFIDGRGICRASEECQRKGRGCEDG